MEIPVYLIEKGKKLHKIETMKIFIKDAIEIIDFVRDEFYNDNIGIDLREHEQFD